MKTEIDQSGKIEETNKDTVLSLANGTKYTVKIPAATKRELQLIFRKQGKPSLFVYRVFATGIYTLLSLNLKSLQVVIIDREYPGHEAQVLDMIYSWLRKKKDNTNKTIEIIFGEIGKKSPAHILATEVTHKKKLPNKILSLKEIAVWAIKKD